MIDEEIRTFLRQHKIHLNTDLGQHFLTDEEALQEIVIAANVSQGDRVIEIGPGIGVLTRELLKRGAEVDAIEIDPRMVPLLKIFCDWSKKLHVTQGNALHTPMPDDGKPYKVVANIPYHITSPLLHHLFVESPNRPTSLTLLIQREVAENICSPSSPSILAVLAQMFGKAELVRLVGRDSFLPPPEVESAVIKIETYPEPLVPLGKLVAVLKVAKHAMSGRRKMLSNTIGSLPHGMDAMEEVKIDAKRRPQTLTIHEWIALEQALAKTR